MAEVYLLNCSYCAHNRAFHVHTTLTNLHNRVIVVFFLSFHKTELIAVHTTDQSKLVLSKVTTYQMHATNRAYSLRLSLSTFII